MSKYIDADLYVEMQLYDDEYEEWGVWNGTIEDLLNQWTEEGCPPPIEVSERTGEWIRKTVTVDDIPFTGEECSNCNFWKNMGIWNYCPNCGAKMG